MNFTRNGRGFTLVELLVVIAIIGILGSIIFARVGNARAKAQNTAVFATVRDIAPVLFDCVSNGYTIAGATDTVTGGGVICSSSTVSDREWPSIESSTWQWRSELDTPTGVDAGWLLVAYSDENFISCEAQVFTCKITEGALSL